MITLSNINDIEKIIRSTLIAQSELPAKSVRNALSLHGEALDKWLNDQIYVSVAPTNAIMLFELQSRENQSDMSESENDESISYYKSFKVYVILYGDNSTNIADNIVARFRTEDVRMSLYGQGIYLEQISNPTRINEYKNETMWIRNDIEIDISCQLTIEPISKSSEMEELNDTIITTI